MRWTRPARGKAAEADKFKRLSDWLTQLQQLQQVGVQKAPAQIHPKRRHLDEQP